MNKVLLSGMILGLSVMGGAFNAHAVDPDMPTPAEAAAMPLHQGPGELPNVGNKICPVGGEEVGSGGMTPYQVTHKGKVYNLCCVSCLEEFNKDPDKYTKIAEEEAAK